MFFAKNFLLTIFVPFSVVSFAANKIHEIKKTKKDLEKNIVEDIFHNISTNENKLDAIISAEDLFTNNLTTFSKNLIETTTEEIAFKWLESQKANRISEILRRKINKALGKASEKKYKESGSKLSYDLWSRFFIREEVLEIFRDYVIEQIISKILFIDSEKKIKEWRWVSLSHFAVSKWIKNEKPFTTLEKEFLYSDNLSKFYDSPPLKATYAFPAWSDDSSLSTNISPTSSDFRKWYSKDELKQITDSHWLSSLLLAQKNDNNILTNANSETNLLKTFFINNSNEFKFNSSVLKSNVAPNGKDALLSIYKDETNRSKVIYVSRHNKGATSFTIEDNTQSILTSNIYDLIHKNDENKKDFNLIFTQYLKENFNAIICDFISSEKSDFAFNGLIKISDDQKKLLIKSVQYFENLSENNSYHQILKNLSKSFEKTTEWTYSNNNNSVPKIKILSTLTLDKKHGLITPIMGNRNLNTTDEIHEIKLNQTNSTIKNDGSFTDLLNNYFLDIKHDNLYKKANELKLLIKKFVKENDFSKTETLNNYFGYSMIKKFYLNNEKLLKIKENIEKAKEIEYSWDKDNLEILTDHIFKTTNSQIDNSLTKQRIKLSVLETFHLKKYLKLSTTEKINFGGYKKDSGHEQLLIKSANFWTINNYFFNDFAYEISSEASTEYIDFLHKANWLFKKENNQTKNLSKAIKQVIPFGQKSFLVWMSKQEVSESNKVEAESENSKDKLKDLQTLGKSKHVESIFNPIYNKSTFSSNSLTSPITFVQDSHKISSAVAYKNTSTKYNLSNFFGIVTPDIEKEIIPEFVKKHLFEKWELANPTNNKNYLANGDASGSAFYIMSEQNINSENIDEIFKPFRQKQDLVDFISKNTVELNMLLSEKYNENNIDLETATKNDVINLIKEIFKDSTNSEKLKKDFLRFSGNIQNEKQSQMLDSKNKFLITENPQDKSGYIVFVKQVNQFDYLNKLSKLKDVIDSETIVKSILLISENKKISFI